MEERFHPIEGLAVEGHDFLLAVHDEAQGDALHPASGEFGLDLAPQHGREFEAHEPVQHAPGLLRIHQVQVDVPGMLDGLQDGRLGDFMEYDAAGFRGVQAQRFRQVPGDGFPFAVLIGGEPDGLGGRRELLQFGDDFLLVGRNHVFGLEAVCDVHAQFLFLQVTDMSDAGFDEILFAQVLLDGLHLSGRLYDDQVFSLHYLLRLPIILQSKRDFGDYSKFSDYFCNSEHPARP